MQTKSQEKNIFRNQGPKPAQNANKPRKFQPQNLLMCHRTSILHPMAMNMLCRPSLSVYLCWPSARTRLSTTRTNLVIQSTISRAIRSLSRLLRRLKTQISSLGSSSASKNHQVTRKHKSPLLCPLRTTRCCINPFLSQIAKTLRFETSVAPKFRQTH